ncbi:MAG: hypothetical protein D6692_05615 [Planctomycetota bacterium]|nr:MAG: hypothetical protein D6692_05615 [Planctomycetota bacterium]
MSAVRLLHAIADSLSRTAIWVFDEQCRVVWCTAECTAVFGIENPNDMLGKRPSDLLPGPWAGEREAMIRRCIDEQRPLCLLFILSGKRKMIRFVPVRLNDADETAKHALLILEPADLDRVHRVRREMPADTVVFSRVHDLGRLDALSPRELEVLALLGEGLRSKDIAEILKRSVSTIEGHRERMGTKLGLKDRADLIMLAREAALMVEDADGQRIRFYSTGSDPDLPQRA